MEVGGGCHHAEEGRVHALAAYDHGAPEEPVAAVLAVGLCHVVHFHICRVALELGHEQVQVKLQVLKEPGSEKGAGSGAASFVKAPVRLIGLQEAMTWSSNPRPMSSFTASRAARPSASTGTAKQGAALRLALLANEATGIA